MSPFSAPKLVLSGIREKIESVAIYGTLELSKVVQPELIRFSKRIEYISEAQQEICIYTASVRTSFIQSRPVKLRVYDSGRNR